MHRGEIWWASLRPPAGSGPGYRRPVLVVQANEFNESRIQTIIIVSLTTNLRLAAAPGNVLCRKRETGFSKDSVANVSQLLTVDKGFLTKRIGRLPVRLLQQVDEGMRLVLSL